MANRSEYPGRSMHLEAVDMLAVFQGAAAAVPVIPATTVTTAADNFGTATGSSRSGVGTYVLALKEKFPKIMDVIPTVLGTDGKRVQVTAWSEANGTVSVQAYTAAGAAVDLAATDFLRLWVKARNSI